MADDLPWPELGNVSRGATRGNQGAKGNLGPADHQGRAILQLRVQPGVLAVKLNPLTTEWYRLLDAEVQRALKETKTYWRKARRRQDYDARADQDHMELHEWLQQLKDKVMAHLELLLQKGEIIGPPYVMPDHLELAFMRGFVDRHRAGIPHNPRLRGLPHDEQHHIPPEDLEDDPDARGSPESIASPLKSPTSAMTGTGRPPTSASASTSSPTWSSLNPMELSQRVDSAQQTLRQARSRLRSARTASHSAYLRYTQSLEQERTLESEVIRGEERLHELLSHLANNTALRSSSSSATLDSVDSFNTPVAFYSDQAQAGPSDHHARRQQQQQQRRPLAGGLAPPSSHTQQQQAALMHAASHAQPQPGPYAPYLDYGWAAVSSAGGHTQTSGLSPPGPRPGSTSSSGGGGGTGATAAGPNSSGIDPIDLELEIAAFGPDVAGLQGGGAQQRSQDEWAAPRPGAEGDPNIMRVGGGRSTSPQRKHPRDWEASQSQRHTPAQIAISDSADDASNRPPRKRMNQSDQSASGAMPMPLSIQVTVPSGTPHTHTPTTQSPHPHSHAAHQQQQQYHGSSDAGGQQTQQAWPGFTPLD